MPEIELKLSLARKDQSKVLRALRGIGGPAARPTRERMVSTYYDTPDLDLRRAGYTLRVRKVGGAFIQNVKSTSYDGRSRDEFEDPLAQAEPDIHVGASGKVVRRLLGKKAKLVAQFLVVVTRTRWIVRHGAGVVEVALDAGEIKPAKVGAKKAPHTEISEIEFELKEGAATALYELALTLARSVSLHNEPRSKSARGYAMLRGEAPAIARSAQIELKRSMSIGHALGIIGLNYLHQFESNIPAAFDEQDEAIHQMRVALRRLRAAWGAAKAFIPLAQYESINGRLKEMLKNLGSVRNWDVLRTHLEEAPAPVRRRATAYTQLLKIVKTCRRTAHAQACKTVRAHDQIVAFLEVEQWFARLAMTGGHETTTLQIAVDKAAQQMLTREFKRVRKRGRNFEDLDADGRHKLRLACKTLRYTAEIVGPFFGRHKMKTFISRLKPLQDDLGKLNDIRTAHELLEARRLSPSVAAAAGEVLGWWDREAVTSMEAAGKHVAKLLRAPQFWAK